MRANKRNTFEWFANTIGCDTDPLNQGLYKLMIATMHWLQSPLVELSANRIVSSKDLFNVTESMPQALFDQLSLLNLLTEKT